MSRKTQKKISLQHKKEAAEARALLKKKKVAAEVEQEENEEILDEEVEIIEEDGESPEEEVEGEEEEEPEEKEIQKDMPGMDMVENVGPTSFEELDAEAMAREQAQCVQEVSWQLQDIIRNIMRDPGMEVEEKVTAMKTAAEEFGGRVTEEIAAEEAEKSIEDTDLLEIQALLSHDDRHITLKETIADIISKATLSSASRKKLPESKFALPSKRKYPINDKAHVRNALARAAQQIGRGGQSAADARAALPKIRAAAKKMGIQVSTKKEHNAILVEKGGDGNWRWVGWVSNNFIDWDGDIITEAAHKEYVEWWEKNRDVSPVFVSWHTPGTGRTAPVDFVTYENGFLVMSGPLTEAEATLLLKAQQTTDLGMSHGTFVFERDPNDPRAITKYRMYEVSDLPLENAANPFTDFQTITKEVGNMDKLVYLTNIMGSKEKAALFLEKTGMKQKELQEVGITSKEEKPVEEVVPVPAPVVPAPAPVMDEKQLIDRVLKELDINGLNEFVTQAREAMEKVPVLESLIKELQGTQEEKLAEKLTPPAARFAWSVAARPSQSEKTVVKEDDPLTKATPGVPAGYWLSELTKTAPVKSQ